MATRMLVARRYVVARGKLRLELHDHGGGCTWEHESCALWTTEFATRAEAQAVIDTYARSTQRTMRIVEVCEFRTVQKDPWD